MKKTIAQFIAIIIGAGTGGTAFTYAAQGAISWWFVIAIFAWVAAVSVHTYLVCEP